MRRPHACMHAIKHIYIYIYLRTEYYDDFSTGLWKGIRGPTSRIHDDGAVNRGSSVVVVGVPPKRSLFVGEGDGVDEVGSGLNCALGDVFGAIRPWIPWLLYSMPAFIIFFSCRHNMIICRMQGIYSCSLSKWFKLS